MSTLGIKIVFVRNQAGRQFLIVRTSCEEQSDFNVFTVDGDDIIEATPEARDHLIDEIQMAMDDDFKGDTINYTIH